MENRKIRPRDVVLGKVKRTIKCIQVYQAVYINKKTIKSAYLCGAHLAKS